MERRKMMRRKVLNRKTSTIDKRNKIKDQATLLWQNPMVKGLVVVGALYGTLFISKYIIREYAEVVVATRKLKMHADCKKNL